MRTFPSDHEQQGEITTVIEAIRATSAALTYFKPLKTGNRETSYRSAWIDAGTKFNNPAAIIYQEASSIWGGDQQVININDIAVFMSIGNGLPTVPKLRPQTLTSKILTSFNMPFEVVKLLKTVATDTETVHSDQAKHFRQYSQDAKGKMGYYRFNVIQELGAINLDDFEKTAEIWAFTNRYLKSEPLATEVNKFIPRLEAAYEALQAVPLDQMSDLALNKRLSALQM